MIDSHSHIYTHPFDQDRPEVINRAREAGITQLLQVGCNLEESGLALELARKVPGIYAALGVHPHDADTWNSDTAIQLTAMLKDQNVIAYGEIGLDFFYDNSPREIQISAFEKQMELVKRLQSPLPVVIHTREAEEETLTVLRKYPLPGGGHVHCYTSSLSTAEKILDLGYYIGFTGVITFKNAAELRNVVKMVPLNRILIETDSPYLAPMPHRGKRNEPAFVLHTAKAIADVKSIPLDEVLDQTTTNFYNLYSQPGMTWETL